MTTACCGYKGLKDDCYELETIRKLRDQYIMKQSYGKELIDTYYAEAPAIVDSINTMPNREAVWEKVYNSIQDIVKTIDDNMYDEAVIKYMILFHRLSKDSL